MKTALFVMCFFIPTTYATVNCVDNPIYCQIVKNKPTINKAYAFKLSNIIYSISVKNQISSRIFTAILAQESMYRLNVKSILTGLVPKKPITIQKEYNRCIKKLSNKECVKLSKTVFGQYRVETLVQDIGISQIYYKTANSYKFDVERLVTDLEYSVNAGAIVLKGFKRRWYKKEPLDWWVRYNCGNKKSTLRKTCKEYKELVKRWM